MAIDRLSKTPEEALLELPVDMNGAELPMGEETMLPDGSVEIAMDEGGLGGPAAGHTDNLVEQMEEDDQKTLALDIIEWVASDISSREDWEKTYRDGIKLVGFDIEERTRPFSGACGIRHPIMGEAIVRFQSQAVTEIFPAAGPCRTKIVGKKTPEKTAQAQRVQDYMNWMTTEEMEEFREETDRMLFVLPEAGHAFKKVYWDPDLNRPVSVMIPPEDVIVPYGATSLRTTPRATHRMRKDRTWMRRMQDIGFYKDCELVEPVGDSSDIDDAQDKRQGRQPGVDGDDRHTLYECHVTLDMGEYSEAGDFPEGDAPYICTVDLDSRKLLSIRKNWEEGDESLKKLDHMVSYQYIPGNGFYAFGLIHLIGGLTKGATSILRQLVDAGTYANTPGGFKTREMKTTGDNTPIAPGEWREVNISATQKLQDALLPLPYKEPSTVLHSLLRDILEEGRRFASLSDMKIDNMQGEAPVGTTLALIERNMKVMTSIQARLHASMKQELNILVRLIRESGVQEYPFEVEGHNPTVMEDFDGRVDVIPVSDPNSSTQAQRIMQAQSALQLAAMAPPGTYDLRKLHRYALETMGVPDAEEILPLESDIHPMDPVSENMRVLSGDPVKAFPYQDHDAHIGVHMMGMQDPKVQQLLGQSPKAAESQMQMMAHVTEHLAMKYRADIEQRLGVPLPPPEEPLPQEIEIELSRMVVQAANDLFNRNKAEVEQAAIREQIQDPIVVQRQMELDIKELDTQIRAMKTVGDLEMKDRELTQRAETDEAKIRADLLGEILQAAAKTESLEGNMRQKVMDFIKDVHIESERAAATKDSGNSN